MAVPTESPAAATDDPAMPTGAATAEKAFCTVCTGPPSPSRAYAVTSASDTAKRMTATSGPRRIAALSWNFRAIGRT